MNTITTRTFALALAFAFTFPLVARADASTDKAVQKTLKTLVGAIRYGKDDLAAKQLALAEMGNELLTDNWDKLSSKEQTEFKKNLEGLLRAISFPRGREMFQYLDAMLYDPARIEGKRAKVKSTIVVHRNLKKAEIVIDWVLVNDGGWKVVDTVMLGESTLAGLRDEQVKPLLQKGGTQAVLTAMRDKLAEVKKK